MGINQIRVGGVRFECLEGVADASRYEHRAGWVQLGGEDRSEGRAGPQVDPRTEHSARNDRHPFVPRFGVNTAGSADCIVE